MNLGFFGSNYYRNAERKIEVFEPQSFRAEDFAEKSV